jgi:hypothetical protein
MQEYPNFRAPDLIWKNFLGGPGIHGTYKICSKNKRKFKMQQSVSKINGAITQKKVTSTPMDIPLQTVKNSGPSERKAVQGQICKYL